MRTFKIYSLSNSDTCNTALLTMGFPCGSVVKNHLPMQKAQEMWVQFLGLEDPLEEEMATYSSILAWKIPWTEEPGRLQSRGLQRFGQNWETEHTHIINYGHMLFIQFSSVTQSCLTLCNSMNCSMPGLPVRHQLPEFTQTHVHWVGDAIQPSHPLSSPSPPAFNLSQHEGLFQWVSSSHQVARILEFPLQQQSFQWTLRTDFL